MNDKVEQLTNALKGKGEANQALLAKIEGDWVDLDASSVESDGEDEALMAIHDSEEASTSTSPDDDEKIVMLCQMAHEVAESEEPKHITKDDIASGRQVEIVLTKVNEFNLCEIPEVKNTLFCSLHHDLVFVQTTCSETATQNTSCIVEVNKTRRQLEEQNVKMLQLHDSIFYYDEVVRERDNLQLLVNDQKKILERWSKSSGISHDLIKDQIPFQTNCISEGKLKVAALTTEIFEMESEQTELKLPNFPPNYQTLAQCWLYVKR